MEIVSYKNITTRPIIKHNGTTYQINNHGDRKLSLFTKDLKAMITQLEVCNKKFGRVLMVRVDLHTPSITGTHKYMSRFMDNLVKTLERKFKLGKHQVGYAWCAEFHGDGKGQHYHLALFLNGNTIRSTKLIKPIIHSLWAHPAGGYLSKFETEDQQSLKKKRHHMMIESKDTLMEAVYWLSYLAKVRGKLQRNKQTKDYSTSRIKLIIKTETT